LALEKWRCTVEIVRTLRTARLQGDAAPLGGRAHLRLLGRYRRLNRDYERQAKTGETMVQLAMFRSCSHAWPSSNRFFKTRSKGNGAAGLGRPS